MTRLRDDLLWAGLVAGVWYAVVVVVGGIVTPGYSHVRDHVSVLFQAGSDNAAWIVPAFAAYNVLVVVYAVGVYKLAARLPDGRRRTGTSGGIFLALTGLAGAVTAVLPQDPIGSPVTTTGTFHIVFAGMSSALTMICVVLVAIWALSRQELRAFGWYSGATVLAILVTGPLAAYATTQSWPTMGLLERFPIFAFVQWLVVSSVVLGRSRTASPASPRASETRVG
jgi:hypothetical protein